jgi:hypothetical protein
MSRRYLVFTRPKAQPIGLVGIRRGNDWHRQQALLPQIKTIEIPGVYTTRRFDAALISILVAFHGRTWLARRFCLKAAAWVTFLIDTMQVLPGYSANAMARPTSSVPPLHVDLAEQARAAITQHHRVRSCRA